MGHRPVSDDWLKLHYGELPHQNELFIHKMYPSATVSGTLSGWGYT